MTQLLDHSYFNGFNSDLAMLMMTMMLMLAICAGYYDDVASEDEDDVDAPGHLGLTIMMMLLVKMRKHCRISVTWPMMKVGAQFHCCSIHIIHTLPLILIRNGINGICFDLVKSIYQNCYMLPDYLLFSTNTYSQKVAFAVAW